MKRIMALFLTCTVTIGSSILVYANPIDNSSITNAEEQLKDSQSALESAEDKLFNLEVAIQKLDYSIGALKDEIDQNNIAISKKESEITIAKADVETAEKEIAAQQELFDDRMRAIYKSGSQGYLAIIVKSEDISDLVSKVTAVNRMMNYDKQVAEELKKKREILFEKQKKLEEENAKLIALKADKEVKLSNLNSNRVKQQTLIDEAKKQKNLLAEKVKKDQATVATAILAQDNAVIAMATSTSSSDSDLRAAISYLNDRKTQTNQSKFQQAINRANEIINSRIKSTTGDRGSTDVSNPSGLAVAIYAQKFLGTPYLWGGTTPYVQGKTGTGFDCSGLVQYSYRQFGIYITRTTYTQIKYDGKTVSRDALAPGDLIFFGTWDDPHHVGMYIGNGSFIHAPRTGDVVKIEPLSVRKDYLTAKRIIN